MSSSQTAGNGTTSMMSLSSMIDTPEENEEYDLRELLHETVSRGEGSERVITPYSHCQ